MQIKKSAKLFCQEAFKAGNQSFDDLPKKVQEFFIKRGQFLIKKQIKEMNKKGKLK